VEPSLVLYDGDCGFCSRGVRFVFRRDPKGRFAFASLQSDLGRRLVHEHGLEGQDTLVLVTPEGALVRSTAALRIARGLRAPWPLLYGFVVVPRRLRDWLYDAFARRRHDLFRDKPCPLPSPELRARMRS